MAAAAYRSASLLYEERTGIIQDYTRKHGVEHSEMLAPDGAPSWVFDHHTLWNAVESACSATMSNASSSPKAWSPISAFTATIR